MDYMKVETRDDMARFIRDLLEDLERRGNEWENSPLERYLDALFRAISEPGWRFPAAVRRDPTGPILAAEGVRLTVETWTAPEQGNWKVFAYYLQAASMYE